MRSCGLSLIAAVALGLTMVLGSVPASSLELTVRGESTIELHLRAAGTTAEVRGVLRDDLGKPIPSRTVEVEAISQGHRSWRERLRTDYFGNFSAVVELAPESYVVQAVFDGSSHLSGTRQSAPLVVERGDVALEVDFPEWVHGPEAPAELSIRATSAGEGLPAFATVSVSGETVGSFDLDNQGQMRFDVGPYLAAGINEVLLEIPGSRYRAQASRELAILKVVGASLEGEVEPVFLRMVRGEEVALRLADEEGPLPGIPIEVILEQEVDAEEEQLTEIRQLVEVVTTDRRGRGRALFTNDDLQGQEWTVRAVVTPPAGEKVRWQGPTIEPRTSTAFPFLRTVFVGIFLLGLLWIGRRVLLLWVRSIRSRVARWLQTWRADRSKQPSVPLEEVEQVVLEPVTLDEAIDVPDDETICLQLWDEWRDQPVPRAILRFQSPQGVSFERPVEGGILSIELGVPGVWEITAEARGFVPAETSVRMPGSHPSLRLRMTSVPLKVRRAFRWMVERATGEDPWGRLTPRQIEEALGRLASRDDALVDGKQDAPSHKWEIFLERWEEAEADGRADLLAQAIIAAVEETNYSGRDYDPEVWDVSREAMRALVRSLEESRGLRR